MAWPKPEIVVIERPPVPNIWVWVLQSLIVFIIGLLAAFAFFLPFDVYINTPHYWLLSGAGFLALTGIIVGWRMYSYGEMLEFCDFWEEETQQINEAWREWGMRSVNVLAHFVLTPNHLSGRRCLFDIAHLVPVEEKVLAFDDEGEVLSTQDYLVKMLLAMKRQLQGIPDNMPLSVVVISTDKASGATERFAAHFAQAWQSAGLAPKRRLAYSSLFGDYAEYLENLIDEPDQPLSLVIVNNIPEPENAVEAENNNSSVFMTAFLLADEPTLDTLHKSVNNQKVNNLQPKCSLLRPMKSDDIELAIGQMADMQQAILSTESLWLSHMAKKPQRILRKLLDKHGVDFDSEERTHTLLIDRLAGKPNDLSYWLTLGLACQAASTVSENQLVVAGNSNNKSLLLTMACSVQAVQDVAD